MQRKLPTDARSHEKSGGGAKSSGGGNASGNGASPRSDERKEVTRSGRIGASDGREGAADDEAADRSEEENGGGGTSSSGSDYDDDAAAGGPKSSLELPAGNLLATLTSAADTLVLVHGEPDVLHRIMRYVHAALSDGVHILYDAHVQAVAKKAWDHCVATRNRVFNGMGGGLGRWLLCMPYFHGRGVEPALVDVPIGNRAHITAAIFTPPLPARFFEAKAAEKYRLTYYGRPSVGRTLPRFLAFCRREVRDDRAIEWNRGHAASEWHHAHSAPVRVLSLAEIAPEPLLQKTMSSSSSSFSSSSAASVASSRSDTNRLGSRRNLRDVFDSSAASLAADAFIAALAKHSKSGFRDTPAREDKGGGDGGDGVGEKADGRRRSRAHVARRDTVGPPVAENKPVVGARRDVARRTAPAKVAAAEATAAAASEGGEIAETRFDDGASESDDDGFVRSLRRYQPKPPREGVGADGGGGGRRGGGSTDDRDFNPTANSRSSVDGNGDGVVATAPVAKRDSARP